MTQPRDRRSSLFPFLGSLGFVLVAITVVVLARPMTKDGPNGLLKPFPRTLASDGLLRDTRVRLVQSWVNRAGDQHFNARLPATVGKAYLVLLCDAGTVTVGSTTATCGGTLADLSTYGGGPTRTVGVSASVSQHREWGIALYQR